MRAWLTLGIVIPAAVVTVAVVSSDAAWGAVRKCMPHVRVEASDRESETEARRKAIESWLVRATDFGPEYTKFQLSAEQTIAFNSAEAGAFLCTIAAMPCAVVQNSDNLPPEAYEKRSPATQRGR